MNATTLYRPVGQPELDLIEASDRRRFPPRLDWQPIFYPVLNEAYATRIAREWNTKDDANGNVGYVLRFDVDTDFLAQFDTQQVGDEQCVEYWIPAEALASFNDHIVGEIEVIRSGEDQSGQRMTADEYMAELRRQFPQLAPTLDQEDWRGLLHVETGRFAAFCRKAIDSGDRRLVKSCFSLARAAAMEGDDAVQNAIAVSFVENLNFRDGKTKRRWAYNLLPSRLKADAEALGVAPD